MSMSHTSRFEEARVPTARTIIEGSWTSMHPCQAAKQTTTVSFMTSSSSHPSLHTKMPPPSPLPRYVYKILCSAPPLPLPQALPLSPLDAADGFIHLSSAHQAPGTAARFFSPSQQLWLLKIPLERIQDNTRWEEGNSDTYAHLYGAGLGREEVAEVRECKREEGKSWESALGGEDWLE